MLVERIVRVLLDAELRDELIENGRKTAEAYSWGNTALRHEEFYNGVLVVIKKFKKQIVQFLS